MSDLKNVSGINKRHTLINMFVFRMAEQTAKNNEVFYGRMVISTRDQYLPTCHTPARYHGLPVLDKTVYGTCNVPFNP